ncbi:hypothetical protein FQN54_005331 [Arachnomyces sp. PD_36]|nr:hypothetical protein FQN54_005331 [Arachnomyces sp. PD_36]
MAPVMSKKRKVEDGMAGRTGKTKKRFKKQLHYHSSSEDEEDEVPAALPGTTSKPSTAAEDEPMTDEGDKGEGSGSGGESGDAGDLEEETNASSEGEEGSDSDNSISVTSSTHRQKHVTKRNDPTAFSTSISKILSTKLPTSARADPVLSRSRAATQTTADVANDRLENKARAKLRADKKEELDRGRIKDVLGVESGVAGKTAEEEKRLKKIAQRGVVKLFNAVRAAQVRGEEAAREERKKGTVGMGEREKTVNEVSKQGFLELISGKGGKKLNIEEA